MAVSGLPTLADTMRQNHELAIYCCDCRHKAVVSPGPLAQRVGEDFPVVDLYRCQLLKCTACGSRNATLRISDPHAPFTPGWHRPRKKSNPATDQAETGGSPSGK